MLFSMYVGQDVSGGIFLMIFPTGKLFSTIFQNGS